MLNSCSKCSASLDEDAVFCSECATSVNPQCPNCQKPIINDAKFCKYCAFDLTNSNSSKAPDLSNFQKDVNSAVVKNDIQAISDEKLDKMASLGFKISGATVILAIIIVLWSRSYVNNFSNTLQAEAYKLIGQTDSSYVFAQSAITWGVVILFISIIVMFVCGLWLQVKKM